MALDPSIFFRGASSRIGSQDRLFNTLQGIVGDYQRQQMLREQQRQAELAAQREAAMQPQNILATALQGGQLTPQQRAAFEAQEMMKAGRMALDPNTGQAYRAYSPISLNNLMQAAGGQPVAAQQMLAPPDVPAAMGAIPAGVSPKTRQAVEEEMAVSQAQAAFERMKQEKPRERQFREVVAGLNKQKERIDELTGMTTPYNTGSGAFTAGIPVIGQATGALEVRERLKEVGGEATLQALINLKNAGGTLGATSENELALLQSSVANLNQARSEKQLDESLKKYKEQLAKSAQRLEKAFEEDYGRRPQVDGGVVDYTEFFNANR